MRWSRFHFCPFEGVCPCVHTVCQINSVNCKAVGAYRIRPPWRRKWMFDGDNVFAAIVSFSLIWGRMRYAPTLVRSITCWWFIRRNHFVFAHIRAYAIRPYGCSMKNIGQFIAKIVLLRWFSQIIMDWQMLVGNLLSFAYWHLSATYLLYL